MTSDRDMRTRVIRRGPYTKQNRKQLGHHLAVGAGLGASVGATAGAHAGAHLHARDVKAVANHRPDMFYMGRTPGALARHSRGKVALVGAGVLGTLGALQGASFGSDVARFKRHNAKRKMPVSKAHEHAKEAAATVVGGGAAQGAYQGTGYGTKHWVDSHTRKGGRGVTPAQVNLQDKKLKANKSKFGMRLPKGDPARNNAGYHRAYPKELPHAGKIRLLGHTHEGKLGVAVGATATAIGAGSALAASHHRLHKAEPLAIAGKLWRKPTLRSEFRRAFTGTRRGEDVVAHASRTPKVERVRDAWGYPGQRRTGGHYGGDARKAMNTVIGNEAKNSPHSTAFKAGARTAKTAAVIGRHPEYGISIPAAGGGVGLAHHEIKRSKQKKGTTVAKSAFGVEKREAKQASPGQVMAVGAGTAAAGTGTAIGAHHVAHTRFRQLEGMSRDHPDYGKTLKGVGRALTTRDVASEVAGGGAALLAGGAILHHQKKKAMAAAPIAKYSAGTITYHQHAADTHGRKKASGGRQAAGGLAVGAAGAAAHLDSRDLGYRLARATHSETAQARKVVSHGGLGLAVAGGTLAAVGASRFVHHGRQQNKQSKLAQAARRDRNASLADTMAKSAFGVEKGAMSSTLDAIKGFKGGLTGMVGAERTGAGAAGKIAGANTMGKLRPVGAALTKTPARLATTTGLAGLGTGMALGDGKKH